MALADGCREAGGTPGRGGRFPLVLRVGGAPLKRWSWTSRLKEGCVRVRAGSSGKDAAAKGYRRMRECLWALARRRRNHPMITSTPSLAITRAMLDQVGVCMCEGEGGWGSAEGFEGCSCSCLGLPCLDGQGNLRVESVGGWIGERAQTGGSPNMEILELPRSSTDCREVELLHPHIIRHPELGRPQTRAEGGGRNGRLPECWAEFPKLQLLDRDTCNTTLCERLESLTFENPPRFRLSTNEFPEKWDSESPSWFR